MKQENIPMETEKRRQIVLFVRNLGVPAHLRGYRYLQEAIALTMEDMQVAGNITKLLYPQLALFYQVTSAVIERDIRHAIEEGWKRGNTDLQEEVFGYCAKTGKRRPSNSEFIARAADWLRGIPALANLR